MGVVAVSAPPPLLHFVDITTVVRRGYTYAPIFGECPILTVPPANHRIRSMLGYTSVKTRFVVLFSLLLLAQSLFAVVFQGGQSAFLSEGAGDEWQAPFG